MQKIELLAVYILLAYTISYMIVLNQIYLFWLIFLVRVEL